MTNIAIIGAGGFGTALAKLLAEKKHTISIWAYEKEVVKEINSKHTNSVFLPKVKFPKSIKASTELQTICETAEVVLFVTPSSHLLTLAKLVKPFTSKRTKIACATKGFISIKNKTSLIIPALETIFTDHIERITYISGPTHAEEIAEEKYSGITVACENKLLRHYFQELFNTKFLRVHRTEDIVGAQVGAATKNIIAIFYGILDGLKKTQSNIGDNTMSYVYARGLVEIERIGQLFGHQNPCTYLGLTGAGDLLVTCQSQYGRNRQFGYEIVTKKLLSKYKTFDNTLKNISYLPEGAYALKIIMNMKKNKTNIKTPLIDTLWSIINNGKNPQRAIEEYMREL